MGSVQWDIRTAVSEPGPSVSSQTVLVGMRLTRPPRPCSTIRWVPSSSTIVVSIQIERSGAVDPEPRPRPDPGGLDPGQVEAGEEMVGEGGAVGEVAERLEDPLARDVDLDFGADRTHRGASLFVAPSGRGRILKIRCDPR